MPLPSFESSRCLASVGAKQRLPLERTSDQVFTLLLLATVSTALASALDRRRWIRLRRTRVLQAASTDYPSALPSRLQVMYRS